MAGTIRTLGSALLMALAGPVGGIALLVAAGSGLTLIFDPTSRDGGAVTACALSMMVLAAVIWLLARTRHRARRLVAAINVESGLRLDPCHLLGAPSPIFIAFDRIHRQFVIANAVTHGYRRYDFQHVLRWYADWATRTRMELSGAGDWVRGTHLRSPIFSPVERDESFSLVLEVADPDAPQLAFPMSERAAMAWCARLNAIFNG